MLRVGRQRLPFRHYRSTQMEEARQFGERLFEALMVEAVRDIFRSARGAAESSRKGLRLTLCLSDAPKLMDLPWEFLYAKPRFLSQSIYSPVARSLDLRDVPMAYPLSLPLNVLGLISSPDGFATLDVENEKAKLTRALAPLCNEGVVTLEWLDRGTLRELDEAINQHDEIHVFHFVGHGGYDTRDQTGILILENGHGGPHEVSGEELGLDAALAKARLSIFADGNDIEFGTPVLFLRGKDARLFDVVNDAPTLAPLPAEPEESYVEELKPLSSLDAGITPTYQPWLPRPWQEWWFAFKADMLRTLASIPSRVLARIPTRSLVIGCVLLLLAGPIITSAFGQETASGDRESTLGAVLAAIGFFGLVAVVARAVYTRFRIQFERLRNWWTGNG